jgi:acylphosphatase
MAEGPEDQLEQLLDKCRLGPETAEVGEIRVIRSESADEFAGFDVVY